MLEVLVLRLRSRLQNFKRVQIYDCGIGVVKCFAVYFHIIPKDAKSQPFLS